MSTVLGEIETVPGCSSASIVLVLESAWAVGLGWRRFCGQMSDPFVVPKKGLNDGSQAIYCLGCVQKRDPSRRYGMSCARHDAFTAQIEERPTRPDHTVPYGTELLFHANQALRTWLPSLVPSGQQMYLTSVH
jgi:hypothetical protein